MTLSVLVSAQIAIVSCSERNTTTFTLYRNSAIDHALRIHWATFDANDADNYNLNNCLMAARILNANVSASAASEGKERDKTVGFWCELGSFKPEGTVPTHFPEAFPTDV